MKLEMTSNNIILRIYKGIHRAIIMDKAIKLSAEKRYSAANEALNKFERKGLKKNIEYHLLRCSIDYNLNDLEKSLSEIMILCDKVNKSKKYNEDEKNYIYCYIDKIIKEINNMRSPSEQVKYFGDSTKLEMNNVNNLLSKTFPLI